MKKLLLILTLLFLCSCSTHVGIQNRTEYDIISQLYDSLAKRTPIPPPFMGEVTEKDSLKNMRRFLKLKDSLTSVRQVVAIYPSMEPVILDPNKFEDNQRKLVVQLNTLNEDKSLNIKKVRTSRKDSVVAFEKQHLREYSADYFEIDKLISFSRIVFNKAGDEAAVVATAGTSRLASFTAIYFFKKINMKWILVDSKGLSMS